MANAQELIGQITLTATQSAIVFSNIPSMYRDLRMVFSHGGNSGLGDVIVSANSDTGSSNYTVVEVWGNGSTSGSSTFTRGGFFMTYLNTIGKGNAILDIYDYSATDKHKAAISRGGTGDSGIAARCSRWNSLTAINVLSMTAATAFPIGTTCTLYGVLG